eukprot:GHUV01006587.1.p1 GENE.GHUV01006587.1~~GHUV01006587.1.p1  ORF type:complete len:451 (+),score=121.80 GHUV01006587.1:320-1672(+)
MRQKYGADLSAEQQLQWLHSSQQASHQHHEQRHGSNLPQNLAPDPQQWHTLLQPADTTAQVTAQQEQEQQQQPLIPMGAYTQREQHLQQQEAAGELEFAYVLNDGQPINMIRLIGLKVIFSKQLPNMPKEYICRLLLDRRHHSCALVDKTGAVLGGITYRVFPQQGFGEIAFCAVAASQQVRGFGTRLMNHTKAFARDKDNITHFLTYADNNAVGYFTKQGFTREITLPRERWVGYIKDYDGGTLMECILHAKVPYIDLVNTIRIQKEYLDGEIRKLSNSHVVHPGVKRQLMPLDHARIKQIAVRVDPAAIPGVIEAGWTPPGKPGYRLVLKDGNVVEPTHSNLHIYMGELLQAIDDLDDAWPFRAPVDAQEALDYYDIIMDPVDLSLVAARMKTQQYYISLEMFVADIRKMCDNCRYYNAQTTPYYQCATRLQQFMESYLDKSVVEATS